MYGPCMYSTVGKHALCMPGNGRFFISSVHGSAPASPLALDRGHKGQHRQTASPVPSLKQVTLGKNLKLRGRRVGGGIQIGTTHFDELQFL